MAHHAQDEQVQPHGMQRQELLPIAGVGGQKHPSDVGLITRERGEPNVAVTGSNMSLAGGTPKRDDALVEGQLMFVHLR